MEEKLATDTTSFLWLWNLEKFSSWHFKYTMCDLLANHNKLDPQMTQDKVNCRHHNCQSCLGYLQLFHSYRKWSNAQEFMKYFKTHFVLHSLKTNGTGPTCHCPSGSLLWSQTKHLSFIPFQDIFEHKVPDLLQQCLKRRSASAS